MKSLRYTAVLAVVSATGLIAPSTAQAVVADAPPSTVEDYAYPGAAHILDEHGLKVFTGDGNIRFAEVRTFGDDQCPTGQIQVEQWINEAPFGLYYCFDVSGPVGFLTLEVPTTGAVRGGSQPVDAITTWRGAREVHHVPAGQPVPIRPGEDSEMPESVLVELRLTGTVTATQTPSPHPYVARVQVGGTDPGARACSGVLVRAQWLLTAKTCFAADGAVTAGPPPKPTSVVVGRTDLQAPGGHETTVIEVVPHASRDIALAKLALPAADITPVALAGTPAQADQELVAAGYGRTATSWVGRQLKADPLRVSEVAADTVTAVRAGAAPSTCKGDLGGPLLRSTAGGQFEVVAIHGPSWQPGCFDVSETRDAAVESRVDDLAGWIAGRADHQVPPQPGPVADVTGDGYHDLLGTKTDGSLWLFTNNILRDGGRPYGDIHRLGTGWEMYASLISADITGDDYKDLIGVKSDGTLSLYTNSHDRGHPYDGIRLIGVGWGIYSRIIAADANGDGYDDMLGVKPDGTMWLYVNSKDGTSPYSLPRQVGIGWDTYPRIIAADATGDGYTDLLGVTAAGVMSLYSNNWNRDGGRPYGDVREIGTGWNNQARIIPGDVTGDGFIDLLGVTDAGNMALFPNNFLRDGGRPYSDVLQIGTGWSDYPGLI